MGKRLSRWPARILVGVLAGSFFLFLGIPLAALIIREPPAMLWQAIQRPESIEALQLSLITTTISTLLTLVFGLPVAYILARLHFPGRNLLETLVTMPTVLPPVVAGVALLITFARNFPGTTETTPIAVYIAAENDLDSAVSLAVVLLAVSFAVLLALRIGRSRIQERL